MIGIRRIWRFNVLLSVTVGATLASTGFEQAAAGPYSAAVLADSPVAYYRLDETSGTIAVNSGTAGAGIDGAYVNVPGGTANNMSGLGVGGPQSPGFAGFESDNRSVFLDPEDGSAATDNTFPRIEVSVPDDSATSPLAIAGALTLEAWIFRSDDAVAPGNNEGIVGRYRQDQNGAARSYVLYFDSSAGDVVGAGPGLGLALSSTGSFQGANTIEFEGDIPIGEWTHVAAVFDPGVRMSLYVNGAPIGEKSVGVLNSSLYTGEGDLWIGQQFTGADEWTFEGGVDEVAIYAAALSDAQIAAHYLAAARVPEPSAVALIGIGLAMLGVYRRSTFLA